jgi:putative ABC transport system permease protein
MNWPFMTLLVKTRGNPADQIQEVRARIRTLDSRLPLDDVASLTGRIDRTLAERRALLVLLGLFAGVALILAAVGLYGLMAYSVRQRFQEIGIRMALGARRASVVALVVRQGLLLAVAGVVLGLAGAVGVTRLLSSHLYGIEAIDPRTFGALSILLVAVAALASYLPARRAARVDPNEALRTE